ncbi:MAG: RsbRD N-terminal domain-containing protein [Pseudomonadota bacterium]
MKLRELLGQKRATVKKAWLDKLLATYPADTAAFLKREKDPFANPVGRTLINATESILDVLFGESEVGVAAVQLEQIIRIRSVQEFSPSEVIGFIFGLKEVLRKLLEEELKNLEFVSEFFELESRIDQLALLAVDSHSKCREEIYELRVNETKRMVSGLIRRMNTPKRHQDLRSSPDENETDPGQKVHSQRGGGQ